MLDALAATRLTREPGSKWEYSNFAMMVLSYALARRSGKDYETLLRERLLVPLEMNETYVNRRPSQVHVAQGHLPNAMPSGPWDFHPDMAGGALHDVGSYPVSMSNYLLDDEPETVITNARHGLSDAALVDMLYAWLDPRTRAQ